MVYLSSKDISTNLNSKGMGNKVGSGIPIGMPIIYGNTYFGWPLNNIRPNTHSFGKTVGINYSLKNLPLKPNKFDQQLFPNPGGLYGELGSGNTPGGYIITPGGSTWGYYGGGQLHYNPYVFGKKLNPKKYKKKNRRKFSKKKRCSSSKKNSRKFSKKKRCSK